MTKKQCAKKLFSGCLDVRWRYIIDRRVGGNGGHVPAKKKTCIGDAMRKHFIDNLRWICVLLLIPYHTCMIYNRFGENFYVRGAAFAIPNAFI
jgi:hypothetical protein